MRKKKYTDEAILKELSNKKFWSTNDKTLFRKTTIWTNFRNKIVKEREHCELCGFEKRLTLHHIYLTDKAEDYQNLISKRFKVLCSGCHKWGHRVWSSYKRKKNPIKPDKRLEEILNEFFKE